MRNLGRRAFLERVSALVHRQFWRAAHKPQIRKGDRRGRRYRRPLLRLRTDEAWARRHCARGIRQARGPRPDRPRRVRRRTLRGCRSRALHQARLRALLGLRQGVRPPVSAGPPAGSHDAPHRRQIARARRNSPIRNSSRDWDSISAKSTSCGGIPGPICRPSTSTNTPMHFTTSTNLTPPAWTNWTRSPRPTCWPATVRRRRRSGSSAEMDRRSTSFGTRAF